MGYYIFATARAGRRLGGDESLPRFVGEPVGEAALPRPLHGALPRLVDRPDPHRDPLLVQRGPVALDLQGWSLRWYTGDPDLSVLHDTELSSALLQSLRLAAIAVLVTVPLGLALAIGLTRWRGRGAGTSRGISLATLVTPEIVMGTALLLVFVHLLTFIPLGTPAQAIGHITFSLVFVLIIVRARLLAIGPSTRRRRDLGASRIQAVRLALLPMLVPAIVASGIIVFAISMDDFVISAFLSSGTSTDTVPVRIYSTGRTAPTPH